MESLKDLTFCEGVFKQIFGNTPLFGKTNIPGAAFIFFYSTDVNNVHSASLVQPLSVETSSIVEVSEVEPITSLLARVGHPAAKRDVNFLFGPRLEGTLPSSLASPSGAIESYRRLWKDSRSWRVERWLSASEDDDEIAKP